MVPELRDMKRSLNVTVEPAPVLIEMLAVFVDNTFPSNVMLAFSGMVMDVVPFFATDVSTKRMSPLTVTPAANVGDLPLPAWWMRVTAEPAPDTFPSTAIAPLTFSHV